MQNDKTNVTNSLRLPLQVAPVDRTPAGAALLSVNGVGASFSWGDLGSLISKAAPIVAGLLG